MKPQAERSSRVLNVFRPQQFLVEQERAESGEVVSVATLFLTNRECPWRCIYCDLWKNTTTETVPFGAIGNNSFIFVGQKSQSPVTATFLMLNLYPTLIVNTYATKADTTITFSGNVTLTAYPPSSLTFDDQGNVTGITGPPDASVPVFNGKLTEWFGGSFNNKNATNTGTINVSASGGGQTVTIHAVFHANWAVGSDLSGPPTRQFDHVTC